MSRTIRLLSKLETGLLGGGGGGGGWRGHCGGIHPQNPTSTRATLGIFVLVLNKFIILSEMHIQ